MVEIDKMLAENILKPAQTEWAASIVVLSKKKAESPFCVNYRKLNAIAKRDLQPIHCMGECIDSLCKATIFSTLEANSSDWQIKIA